MSRRRGELFVGFVGLVDDMVVYVPRGVVMDNKHSFVYLFATCEALLLKNRVPKFILICAYKAFCLPAGILYSIN